MSNRGCGIALFILAWLSPSLSFAAQEKVINVTIAYTSISPQYAPVWIAKEAGFFKRNGVNAQLVYMRGGIVATQALVSNDVNFINAGGGGVVDAVLGGADIVMIACPITQEPQVLVTKREIKELSQLKGKKFAVNSLAGPAMLSLKIMLAASGLDPERDVNYLAVGPSSSRFGALQLGQVDATTLAPPFTFAARKAGYTFFEDLPGMKEAELPNAALATTRKFAEAEPVATEMVIKSLIEGIHFYKTEKNKSTGCIKDNWFALGVALRSYDVIPGELAIASTTRNPGGGRGNLDSRVRGKDGHRFSGAINMYRTWSRI